MMILNLTMKDFVPNSLNGEKVLDVTECALIRGVIAAGRNPRKKKRTPDEILYCDGLALLLRSSLITSGPVLVPSTVYSRAGSTDRAAMSYLIGNSICAFAAYERLKLPWLMDIERLPQHVRVKFKKGKKRPDYIGTKDFSSWYVFESKGRSSSVSKKELDGWKDQAKRVSKINGIRPKHRIVSLARLKSKSYWNALWVDPDGEDGADIRFTKREFFEAYYRPIYSALLEKTKLRVETEFGSVIMLPRSGVSIGLHHEVLQSLTKGEYGGLFEFGHKFIAAGEYAQDSNTMVFADGFLVQLNKSRGELKSSDVSELLPGGVPRSG